jgi:adenosine deaminase
MSNIEKIDKHTHFTGSLSTQFLNKCLAEKHKAGDYLNLTEVEIPKFSEDWRNNYELFFKAYAMLQEISKSSNSLEIAKLYELGSEDITRTYDGYGFGFQLRVGPKKNKDETILRLTSMIKGFQNAERESNKNLPHQLILTLIRDENGCFRNTDPQSLEETFSILTKNKKIRERIVGFDFSGPETAGLGLQTLDYIKEIKKFSIFFMNKFGIKLEVMVHAGELIEENKWQYSMNQIAELINLGIERLSHGTILWLSGDLISEKYHQQIGHNQSKLLKSLAKNKIHLEICPSANYYLSPLQAIGDIPLKKLKSLDIDFSINTDNMTLFGTTPKRERKILGLK